MSNVHIENRFTDHGVVSWFEIHTKYQDETINFFQSVFDYSINQANYEGYHYPVFTPPKTKAPIGAILNSIELGLDAEHKCVATITANNVDEILDNAERFGGKIIKEKTILPSIGEFCILEDNMGCHLYVMKYERKIRKPEFERNGMAPGLIVAGNILSSDFEATTDFYSGLFGYSVFLDEFHSQGLTFYKLRNKTASFFTLFVMSKHDFEAPVDVNRHDDNVFSLYFGTTDIDESLIRIEKFGGSIIMPLTYTSPASKFALCKDPHGLIFGVSEDNEYLKEYII